MFPADVEEECLWLLLEDLVCSCAGCREWLTMTVRADEYLGRRGEVLLGRRFFCRSGGLFLLGQIFLRSAEGDGRLLGHWLQG